MIGAFLVTRAQRQSSLTFTTRSGVTGLFRAFGIDLQRRVRLHAEVMQRDATTAIARLAAIPTLPATIPILAGASSPLLPVPPIEAGCPALWAWLALQLEDARGRGFFFALHHATPETE